MNPERSPSFLAFYRTPEGFDDLLVDGYGGGLANKAALLRLKGTGARPPVSGPR